MPHTLPHELGPAAAVISELRERMRAVELERAAERLRTGGRVQGRRAVLAQSWRDHPASCEPRRNLRPRVWSGGYTYRRVVRDAAIALAGRQDAAREQPTYSPAQHEER
jgi:hypothetical protein